MQSNANQMNGLKCTILKAIEKFAYERQWLTHDTQIERMEKSQKFQ